MAQKRPKRAFFVGQAPRSPSRACRRRPRLEPGPTPTADPCGSFARVARSGAATLGPFAPAGLKSLATGIGSRRRRRRHAARYARFAARPSPGPSGRAAGPPAAAFRRILSANIPPANMWLGWPDRRGRATTGKVGCMGSRLIFRLRLRVFPKSASCHTEAHKCHSIVLAGKLLQVETCFEPPCAICLSDS